MKLPAQPSCALDDDDAASLEASLLEDVAPPEREKEDNTVAILCAAGAAVGALAGGRLVDNVGRKGALLYVAGPLYVVAWICVESKP